MSHLFYGMSQPSVQPEIGKVWLRIDPFYEYDEELPDHYSVIDIDLTGYGSRCRRWIFVLLRSPMLVPRREVPVVYGLSRLHALEREDFIKVLANV